jgi:hypothetical protein
MYYVKSYDVIVNMFHQVPSPTSLPVIREASQATLVNYPLQEDIEEELDEIRRVTR